jgi:Caspase domain
MATAPKFHVLLVGIDSYGSRPLRGCVNDIDAVQRLLLEKAEIDGNSITRLASPHPGAKHEAGIDGNPATLANIHDALKELGSDKVDAADRVFIYYSGHGGRALADSPQGTFACESLVPVDYDATPGQLQLLPDFEFNRLLAGIVKRTRSVAVVLDCCHSAGATRELPGDSEMTPRSIDFSNSPERIVLSAADAGLARAIDGGAAFGSVDDCQVVAACLNHELAQECQGDDGVRHGLLTRAFFTEVGRFETGELLTEPWARVWQKMRDSVETANPMQHLWMSGNNARAILAGPPVDGDAGFAVRKTGANEYAIDAGTLADVSEGAKLAVYADTPKLFPALGTAEDLKARASKSLLVVQKADRANAVARSDPAPFELPAGARARLVAAGKDARLRCAVVPEEREIVSALEESEILLVGDEREALVLLKRANGGAWELIDDVNGAKPGFPALLTLKPGEIGYARQVLELYTRYSLPLRMATQCRDFPGQLQVKLLDCPDGVPEEDAQKADLPEVPRHKALNYTLKTGEGAGFCIHVRNGSIRTLRVVMVNCASSGTVEFLGDQIIEPRSYYRFWLGNNQGVPFEPQPGKGDSPYIDRMVAIGTTLLDKDLHFLESKAQFSDILKQPRGDSKGVLKELGGASSSPPVEKWTATQMILGIGMSGEGAV